MIATRVGLWLAIGLGALGGIAGAVRAPASAPPVVGSSEQRGVPAAATGFAEFVVRRWVETDGAGGALDGLFLRAPDLSGAHRWPAVVRATNVVAAQPIAPEYWAVTVAVDFDAGPPPAQPFTWFLEVGVVGDDHGSLAAAAEPAVVAAPRKPTGPQIQDAPLTAPSPDDPVAATVAGFLGALLTGDGHVDRYTSAGVAIAAVTPPPFAAVTVDRMSATRAATVVQVQAVVRARTAAGEERLLDYQLELVRRDDRWEVRSMTAAPALAATRAEPSTSTTSVPAASASPGA